MTRKFRLSSLAFLILLSCQQHAMQNEAEENFAQENYMGENMVQSAGNPAEQVYCDVLEQQAPRKDCDLISKVAQVTDGSGAFNVPDPMKRGDRTSVMLVVDRRAPKVIHALDAAAEENASDGFDLNATASDGGSEPVSNQSTHTAAAQENASANMTMPESSPSEVQNPTPKQQTEKLPGTTDTYDLKVGRRMRAELTGQGFRITQLTPAVQEIPLNDQGTWSWEVVAVQGGPKTLTVTTVVEASVNGHVYQLRKTKHLRTVTVGVSLPDRVKDWLRGLPEWLQLIAGVLTALASVAGAWWLVKRNWRSGPTAERPSGGDPT